MSAIRPGLPLPLPGVQPASDARPAQAAFFRAALNQNAVEQTAAPKPPVPAAAVMSTIRTANPARPVEAPPAPAQREEPRIMRPGSYLDIRV